MRKKLPEIGDKRTLKKFAWLPLITDDKYKIWLENVIDEEEFVKGQSYGRWSRKSRKALANSLDFITKK